MRYIASCSFGKDSLATIILAKENNEPLDEIIFSEVMFDDDISGELPEHIDFIYNSAIPKLESWGYKVTVLKSNRNYMDCFNFINSGRTRPERKGKKYGFPMSGKCIINRECKVKPIKEYLKNQTEEYIQYIGIATDEPKRLLRLVGSNKISLLDKYRYTERMAFDLCLKYDLLSPIYFITKRGGCWFCPNARDCELRHIRDNHVDLWHKLLVLEEQPDLVGNIWNTLTKTSIHDKEEQFLWEDLQMDIFDFI